MARATARISQTPWPSTSTCRPSTCRQAFTARSTPNSTFPGGPRYYNYAPPAAMGEASGEPSIGYNLTTHHAMYIAGLQTLRVTFPENIDPKGSLPEAADATWDDVSFVLTHTRSL